MPVMARFFNTAGPCRTDDHYMLPPEERVSGLPPLIEEKAYFVIHAPRQVGKTTSLRSLAASLTSEGHYLAVHASCERGQDFRGDPEWAVSSVVEAIARETETLPESLRPPPVAELDGVGAHSRLIKYLTIWCERCPQPVVLFLDEIDALIDHALISVLRQLREGYPSRPVRFPHSIALIGMRDVRDYKVRIRPDSASLGTASPFNIKVESLRLRNFNAEEVTELYRQHTGETGQDFTSGATDRAFELTRGQPWLVNALARQLVQVLVPDRQTTIAADDVDRAAERLIERRDTHIDSLIERLREARVERIIAPILAGEIVVGDRLRDDIAYVEDLGLVDRDPGHLQIANPIYHQIIPRALASETQFTIVQHAEWYSDADGRLDMPALLAGFLDFWRRHGEPMLASQPYKEVAFQLLVMSFLQRIANGGGSIVREYALGRGRMDIVIHWPYQGGVQEEVLELKVWRDGRSDPEQGALDQLSGYLEILDLDHGALLIFDRRQAAPPLAERGELCEKSHKGRRIQVMRL